MMVCLNYAFNVDINTINATISTVGTSRLFIGNCNGIGGSISDIIGFLDCSFAAVVGTSNMRIGTVGISALLEITMGIETAVVISLVHELLPFKYHFSLLDAAAVLPFSLLDTAAVLSFLYFTSPSPLTSVHKIRILT